MGRGTRGTDRFLYLPHFSNTFLWGCPLIFRKMFASTHLYTWVERYCVSKVSQCPKTVPGALYTYPKTTASLQCGQGRER